MTLYQWLCVAGIPTIIGILIAILIKRPLEKKIEESERQASAAQTQQNAIAAGIQALLRDRLLQGYKFYEAQGWADYEDKSNLDNVYQQYHALGKNGVMDARHDRFISLPDHP